MEEEREEGLVSSADGSNHKNKPSVLCVCMLCVFKPVCQVVGTVCALLFPPVQVASHGEPH